MELAGKTASLLLLRVNQPPCKHPEIIFILPQHPLIFPKHLLRPLAFGDVPS